MVFWEGLRRFWFWWCFSFGKGGFRVDLGFFFLVLGDIGVFKLYRNLGVVVVVCLLVFVLFIGFVVMVVRCSYRGVFEF